MIRPAGERPVAGLGDDGFMYCGDHADAGPQRPCDKADAAVQRLIGAARGLDRLPFAYRDPLVEPFGYTGDEHE